MKSKDEMHKKLDDICQKGEEITEQITRLSAQDFEKKLKTMEELEINLNELVGYIKAWNEKKKIGDT
jgi:oligoendopeptidase F